MTDIGKLTTICKTGDIYYAEGGKEVYFCVSENTWHTLKDDTWQPVRLQPNEMSRTGAFLALVVALIVVFGVGVLYGYDLRQDRRNGRWR